MMMTDEERKKNVDPEKSVFLDQNSNNTMSAPAVSSQPARTQNAAGSPKPTRSGSYTNLQSYISKNRSATNQSLDKLKSDSQSLNDRYKNNLSNLQQTANAGQNRYNTVDSDRQYLAGLGSNPYSVLGNADRYNAANQNINASRDPITDYDRAQAGLTGLKSERDNLANINSTGGIRNYLSSIRGDRAGSQGGMNLDQFLLQSTPEANTQLSDVSKLAGSYDLNATPGRAELENRFGQLQGFNTDNIMTQIQGGLQNGLNVNDLLSVMAYNDAQEIYGGAPVAYVRPTLVNTPDPSRTDSPVTDDNAGLGMAPIAQTINDPPPLPEDINRPKLPSMFGSKGGRL